MKQVPQTLKEKSKMPSNLTDTQSAEYDQALAALLAQVSQHPAVLAFQAFTQIFHSFSYYLFFLEIIKYQVSHF